MTFAALRRRRRQGQFELRGSTWRGKRREKNRTVAFYNLEEDDEGEDATMQPSIKTVYAGEKRRRRKKSSFCKVLRDPNFWAS